MAECMGLHRDGEAYGLNPLETHIRRLIWYHICFLDIRTCEAQGPRPSIRKDDFDTKFPRNVDDVDVHPSGEQPASADRWTDVTLTLIRFEINEMMRTIWVDRPRVERRKTTLTAVLSKIEAFRNDMAERYDHLIDDQIPLHRWIKITKSLLISRLYIMLLHRYHNSVVSRMPDRLRQILISSGINTTEATIALERIPELSTWGWYVGALHQYHVAFLLLMDLHAHPNHKDEARIWKSLDYIFDCDPSEPYHIKAKKILSEMQRKTAVYQSMRGMRAPVGMEKHRPVPKQTESHISNSSQDAAVPLGNTSPYFDRISMPDVVFAGISNGEAIWALPNKASPDASSESNSIGAPDRQNSVAAIPPSNPMADVDWVGACFHYVLLSLFP